MKKLIPVIILMFVTIVELQAQGKEEIKVATMVEQLRKAMVDADSVMLDKLTLAKLSYGHSSGHIDNKTEFVEKIISGKSDFVTLEFPEQTIAISKNIAVVRHKFNATTNDNGKSGQVQLAVLLVWQKLHGSWKLLARQAIKST